MLVGGICGATDVVTVEFAVYGADDTEKGCCGGCCCAIESGTEGAGVAYDVLVGGIDCDGG